MNYSPSPHQTELHRPHAFFTQDHFHCLLVGLPQNPEKNSQNRRISKNGRQISQYKSNHIFTIDQYGHRNSPKD